MLNKSYSKTGRVCRVTFDCHPEGNIEEVSLVGEFNDWNPAAHPMKQRKDGRFSATVSLVAGRSYRFRYLVDGRKWENDTNADAYVPNNFGSDDSLVSL